MRTRPQRKTPRTRVPVHRAPPVAGERTAQGRQCIGHRRLHATRNIFSTLWFNVFFGSGCACFFMHFLSKKRCFPSFFMHFFSKNRMKVSRFMQSGPCVTPAPAHASVHGASVPDGFLQMAKAFGSRQASLALAIARVCDERRPFHGVLVCVTLPTA